MSSTPSCTALARFVGIAEGIASRLDFAVEIPEPRCPLADRVCYLERAWWDLRAAAADAGRDGGRLFKVATEVRDHLAAVVQAHDLDGNLEPWERRRGNVIELLEALRSNRQSPTAADVAPRADDVAGQEGEKGEKGENPEIISGMVGDNGRLILRLLLRESADRQSRRWKAEEICDSCKLSNGQYRRAMEQLRDLNLYSSKDGQAGGVWLSLTGVEIARRV
jgi:hypothetical protein